MSALSVHQSLTLPQKIDSREGWFRCKRGVVINAGKMNIYYKEPHLHPFWGYLVLNVVQYGAKRSAFWCKMQCVLVQNAR